MLQCKQVLCPMNLYLLFEFKPCFAVELCQAAGTVGRRSCEWTEAGSALDTPAPSVRQPVSTQGSFEGIIAELPHLSNALEKDGKRTSADPFFLHALLANSIPSSSWSQVHLDVLMRVRIRT